tara:strand:- start:31 stop:369 length:339 start_codon:yes stop_codon:yes gene_type:complete
VSQEEMMLNLLCLERGIVQLSDLEAVAKQFDSLDDAEKRKVSRKIRKLAKKFIKKSSSSSDIKIQKSVAAGLDDAPRSFNNKDQYRRVKLLFARRLLLSVVKDENSRPQKER